MWNSKPRGKLRRKATIASLSAIAVLGFWFLGVDGSWFAEDCPDCGYARDIYQIRIFTIPIYQRTEVHISPLQEVAEDLGVPCGHPHLERWHVERYWGLIIRGWPSFSGIIRLSGGDWYDDRDRQIVRSLAKADPALPQEFYERVLVGHDWEYLRAFERKVDGLRAKGYAPASTNAAAKSN